MKNISKEKIKAEIIALVSENKFNLYKFALEYNKK
jgi:hypothetical protein